MMFRSQLRLGASRGGAGLPNYLCIVVTLAASATLAAPVIADEFSWTGGSFFNDGEWWDDAGNWSAFDIFGFPDNTTDKATVDTTFRDAHLVSNRTIGDLEISDGGDVALDGFSLTVNPNSGASRNGETFVSGTGSGLAVGSGTLDTDLLTIDSGGAVGVTGGLVQVDSAAGIASGGTFSGRGTFQFASGNGGLSNLGTIRTSGGDLVIERTGGGGDFEQNGGALTATSGHTIRVDMPTTIAGGTTTVELDATLQFDQTTTLNGGTIQVDADVEVEVTDDGTILFNGPTNWGDVIVNDNSLPKTGIIRQNGTSTVSGTAGIFVRVYDFDGNTVNAVTTIESGAALVLRVDFIDADPTGLGNNGYEGTLTIEDTAALEVSTSEANWVNQLNGTITLQGAAVAEPQAVVGGQADLTNSFGGTIEGNGTFEVDVTNGNGGIIRPGLSEGVINFKEHFTQQTGGTLEIELQNTPLNAFDQIIVGGSATLAGTLDVTLQSFIEIDGLEFEIIDVGGTRFGEFDGLGEGDHVGTNGKAVFITYQGGDGNDVVLYTASGVPGDYNNDGVADAADYTVWRDALGVAVTLPNDPTPGMVTPEDYGFWVDNFGNTSGSGALATAEVPEPSTALLVAIAAGLVGLCRRRTLPAAAFTPRRCLRSTAPGGRR